jgi:hypothetical protein
LALENLVEPVLYIIRDAEIHGRHDYPPVIVDISNNDIDIVEKLNNISMGENKAG